MRLSFRFLVPLALALFAVAYAVTPVVDGLMRQWHTRDLDIRATLVASSLQDALYESLGARGDAARISAKLNDFIRDERLYGLAVCDPSGARIAASSGFPNDVSCERVQDPDRSQVREPPQGMLHVATRDLVHDGQAFATLVVIHDMSFAQRRSEATKRYLFYLMAAIAAIVSLITVAIAEISWRGWMRGVRALLKQRGAPSDAPVAQRPELAPVARDLQTLIRDLEGERLLRDEAQINWSPESLRNILKNDLQGEEVLMLSNREPYIHQKRNGKIIVKRPASGLVTALEPVMRACSGTWIAHG